MLQNQSDPGQAAISSESWHLPGAGERLRRAGVRVISFKPPSGHKPPCSRKGMLQNLPSYPPQLALPGSHSLGVHITQYF